MHVWTICVSLSTLYSHKKNEPIEQTSKESASMRNQMLVCGTNATSFANHMESRTYNNKPDRNRGILQPGNADDNAMMQHTQQNREK
jgi:hypothetical protein